MCVCVCVCVCVLLISALEDDTKSLFVNLTNLQFLLATAQEKISRMELRELADMNNRNENQQKLIDTLLQQVTFSFLFREPNCRESSDCTVHKYKNVSENLSGST